jgi:hypothetical protein
MRSEAKKKMLLAAAVAVLALALPVALAVVGGMKLWEETRSSPAAEPDTSGLREAAERAAEAALPVPTLAANAETLECAPEKLESEVQRVVRLADGVGGVASSWNDGQSVRIIAKIPGDTESIFRDAVSQGIYDLQIAKTTAQTTIVEVLIKPAQTAEGEKGR